MSNAMMVKPDDSYETVGVRDLKQNASKVVAAVQTDKRPRVITVNGRPAAGLVPLESLGETIVANAIARIGLDSGVFLDRLAATSVPAMSPADAEAWADDIHATDDSEGDVDPWARAGL